MAKKKYNPDDVERWVTVKGARIPIMKDGSFGVGTKESSVSSDTIKKKMYNVNSAVQQAREAKDWKTYREATEEYNRLSNILKETQEQEKTTSRNARYDTSRATGIGKRSKSIQQKSQERAKIIGNYANTRVSMIPDNELSSIVSRLKKANMDASFYEKESEKRKKK